jgi:hypothetical protein
MSEMALDKIAVILADHEGFGRVTKCECGAIHVQVGPINVTFSADAYMQFVDLVNSSVPNFKGLMHAHSPRFSSH